jgi:hypothetical protein
MPHPVTLDKYAGQKVFLCGTTSVVPVPGRTQVCLAVLAGESPEQE